MAIPEPLRAEVIARVEHFCANRIRAHVVDQVRLDYVVRGDSITIRERRVPWRPEYGPEWSTNPRAQLRYDPNSKTWKLYWPDRNSRWHFYPDAEPTAEIEWLLREIDLDPNGAFWG